MFKAPFFGNEHAVRSARIVTANRFEGGSVTEQDRTFIKEAIASAQKCVSEPGRHSLKVGAVVERDGAVLAVAHRGQLADGEPQSQLFMEGVVNRGSIARGI